MASGALVREAVESRQTMVKSCSSMWARLPTEAATEIAVSASSSPPAYLSGSASTTTVRWDRRVSRNCRTSRRPALAEERQWM